MNWLDRLDLRLKVEEAKREEILSWAKKDKAVVNELIKLLEDEDVVVRANAAVALGEIATEDAEVVKPAVPRLIELLED